MEKLENLKDLSIDEMRGIDGGSELTDAIWYGIGFAVGVLTQCKIEQPKVPRGTPIMYM